MFQRAMMMTVVGALALLAGCASKQKQLESVAKDWCMTIRASQVIPVYPLTQDIQPGDVFLVQLPVDKQQQQYREKGFLPLDNHLARLDVAGYADFYSHSFLGKPGESAMRLPLGWMRPDGTPGATAGSWSMAPGAAFPTYSFSVSNSGGLNLAIPISGVPVGFSLLGADSANGSVTIDDARTLGVDIMSLNDQLREWIEASPERRDFLAAYGTPAHQPPRNFLRVITRIYLTGKLDVSLADAEMRGGGADVGVARPVANMLPQVPANNADTARANRENYELAIAQMNRMLAERDIPVDTSQGMSATQTTAEAKAAAEETRKYRAARIEEAEKALKTAEESEENKTPMKKQTAALQARQVAEASEIEAEEKAKTSKLASDAAALNFTVAEAELRAASMSNDADRKTRAQENLATAQAKRDEAKKTSDVDAAQAVAKRSDANTKRDEHIATLPAAAAASQRINLAQQSLDKLKGFAPGGSVRFTAASSRSISMSEEFDPPLVIGYLGFDIPLLEGGNLGDAIPTHALLNNDISAPTRAATSAVRELTQSGNGAPDAVYEELVKSAAKGDRAATRICRELDALAATLPASYRKFQANTKDGTLRQTSMEVPSREYREFKSYREQTRLSLSAVNEALTKARSVVWADGTLEQFDSARPRLELDAIRLEITLENLASVLAKERRLADEAITLYLQRVREGKIVLQ
jgi:hypothetical protein